jgi:putative membrane protein
MTKNQSALLVIFILHAVGCVGVAAGMGSFFWPLTPVNLLFCGGLAVAASWSERTHWWWCVALGGIAAEAVGVQTGWLFGNYHYSDLLGPQLSGVPWMLGWMWLIMLQGVTYPIQNRWLRGMAGASAMTAMDALIEPVAVRAGWWVWSDEQASWIGTWGMNILDQTIPWWNFASWWLVSFALLLWAPHPVNRDKFMVWRGFWWVMAFFFFALNVLDW